VTQIGGDRQAPRTGRQVLAHGTPSVGEILAERYQLQQHVDTDSLGRQVWRGIDVVLRRQVAVILHYPGGDSASGMLSAAVAASRIVHPHLVGVYDAIDEDDRAYVVREWVEGSSLRELIADGPLDPERSTMVAASVADAIAAVHATGMVHGNIHPGTVLVAADGRVMVTDAQSAETSTAEMDVRTVGAVPYCALAARWPHREVGPTAVADAVRDTSGNLASPRQVRSGVSAFLNELTMDLLNPEFGVPSAEILVGELSRLEQESAHPLFAPAESSLRGFDPYAENSGAPEPHRPAGRKIAIGVASLLLIATVGIFGATQAISSGGGGSTGSVTAGKSTAPSQAGNGQPRPLSLAGNPVRIVDGKGGDRSELRDAAKTTDGNKATGWKTDRYQSTPKFGGFKPGMGILVDLGSAKAVTWVQVDLSSSGATLELRAGSSDPGAGVAGDEAVVRDFKAIGEPHPNSPLTVALTASPDEPVRFVLIWISQLPPADPTGGFQLGVQEITVYAQ
jgi:eukaryotic-like serine/threonine-protein kinase